MAQDKGCLLIKLQHGVVGMPDRLLVRPDGSCLFIEFKRPSGNLTKIQAYWVARLQNMGQGVEVIRSAGHFYRLLTLTT